MKTPLASILVCSHNAEEFIKSTVLSILNQTFRDFELLILDDASIDYTVPILKELQRADSRISIFESKKNYGPYKGLNFLIDRARGSYIAINDHDDIWHSSKLEKQINYLESHPESVGCGSSIINWYEQYQKGILRKQPPNYSVAWHTSLVFRNNGYKYDLTISVGTDFYFMHNILCKDGKRIHNIDEPLVFRRIWKEQKNLSSSWMKKMRITDMVKLHVPLVDKLALLNRRLIPSPITEWLLIHILHAYNVVTPKQIREKELLREFRQFIVA